MRDIEDLESISISHKCIAELNCHSRWSVEQRSTDLSGNLRVQRIIEADNFEPVIAEYVGVHTRNGDAPGSVQLALRIECDCAVQEVVSWISIEQRTHSGKVFLFIQTISDYYKPLVLVSSIKGPIHQMNILLFVLWSVSSQWIDPQRRRCSDCRCILALHIELLSKRRDWGSNDFLREIFVVDLGNVINAESTPTQCRVGVFAAQLDVEHLFSAKLCADRVLICFELPLVFLESLVIAGIGKFMEVAAIDRGRFFVLGNGYSIEALFAGRYVDVSSHEVEEIRSLNQDLRHPRVVIFFLRDVTVGTFFRFFRADGMRHIRAEGLATKALGGDGLLLVVKPVALRILRADDHGARGANW